MKQPKSSLILLVGLLSACMLSGCRKPSESIDLTQNTETSVYDIFSDVRLVPLETTEDFLIGQIAKVKYFSDHFYVLDRKTQQILRFDTNGTFVSKISARGRGPGEYSFIADFTIDTINNRLVLLDPAVARVHFFSLDGAFIRSISLVTEMVMGWNKVFVVNDTTLLVSSITFEQLVFVDSRTGTALHKDFMCPAADGPHVLSPFLPTDHIYQLESETFAMRALGRQVFNVTRMKPVLHFTYCFGAHNNTTKQINNLVSEIKAGKRFEGDYQAVGRGKFLNHSIRKVFETKRFHLAILEFDNNYKHVFIDKETGQSFVFNNFSEYINLANFSIQADYAIGFETGLEELLKKFHPGYYNRNHNFYNTTLLSEAERQIIANHDPMTQNPFLVVYRFRE